MNVTHQARGTAHHELGPNEPGELLARGSQVVMEYLNNKKATRETLDKDGWLHTGDIGYVDNEGYFVITYPLKELIKVKELPVSPAELDGALRGHPALDDAAVKGLLDGYSGERPKAYIANAISWPTALELYSRQ
ncbi:hypothetical protein ASPWEDRAFT_174077 [Aspergillus wentii DTO 134E9]|uniref:Uncharacterized protein n=1 Tax=Aspergillus wentii DTO 134E9 TaxID=1073089 RepID=A0A1L9RCK8_ASPWE|nr:uncharacterized protein ASPWEDRAFT_174077 [Aspergillus wentii DTO 134E9]OJJ32628.1 hypothetical protein ASPWEDRAFT_174077 [Aspergillus wentii DTO 134E9]